MNRSVERTSLDLRFASYRLRNNAIEARLLASIAEQGIEQALTGVDTPDGRLLLDGFKRCRCAKRLGIESVPYVSLGVEEAAGILRLMQASKEKTLHMLEQARFVTALLDTHGMTVAEVAETLSRSKAWVSVRRGLLSEMPESLQTILFHGQFPVYSYMYTLRPFMRINGVPSKQIEIELLAHGYFRGPESLRKEIDAGNWKWSLDQLQSVPEDPEACNDTEKSLLRDFETLLKTMSRIQVRSTHKNLESRSFFAQAHLLVGRLLRDRETFFQNLEGFYDRSGQA